MIKFPLLQSIISLKLRGHGNNFYAMATNKRNMLQSLINVSTCPHVKFFCFATFFLKFFVAETNEQQNQTGLNFLLFQQQKPYVKSEETWENPRVPVTWVDFLKHICQFFPTKNFPFFQSNSPKGAFVKMGLKYCMEMTVNFSA